MYARRNRPSRRSQLGFIWTPGNIALVGGQEDWHPSMLPWTGINGKVLDRSNLASMFQDSAGTLPMYQPGQGSIDPPIGLALDLRFGGARGAELWADGSVTFAGESSRVGTGVYRLYTSAGVASAVNVTGTLTVGKSYEITLNIDSVAAAGSGITVENGSAVFTGTGTKRMIFIAVGTTASIKRAGAVLTDYQISNVSVRELPGNHEIQSTAANRPRLSGRFNAVTATEKPNTAPWAKTAAGVGATPVVTENYSTGPLGRPAARVQLDGGGGTTLTDQSVLGGSTVAVFSGFSYTIRIAFKATNAGDVGKVLVLRHVGGSGYGTVTLTADWQIFTRAESGTAASFSFGLRGTMGSTMGPVDFQFSEIDIRLTSDLAGLPSYQRVVDANTYDTAGFPLYAEGDGIQSGMVSAATMDYSATDKMFLCAGLTKLSDAAVAIYIEHTTTSANNGSFFITAPLNSGITSYGFGTRGTVAGVAPAYTPFPAPSSDVLSVQFDHAGSGAAENAQVKARINGVSKTGASGTTAGNYANATQYRMRRAGSSLPYRGRDYAYVEYGATMPAAQIALIERWVASKMKGLVTLP